MARFVPDIISHRWVIISPQRMSRPEKNPAHAKKTCPFCVGNEHMTPPEVFRIGTGEKDKSGWQVRVIPNKYPITDLHEVIIHSPDGEKDLHELTVEHMAMLIQSYRERYNFYKKQGQVLIFCNMGQHAGASQRHTHSQLVVLPFQINLDALGRESQNNMVTTRKNFTAYCPDFSQWPYELWIVPKKTDTVFGSLIDEEVEELAPLMQWSIKQLHRIHKEKLGGEAPFGYNYYIYPKENWYIRIVPRFIHRAGFELGTGLSVNVVDPHDAALEYKKGEK